MGKAGLAILAAVQAEIEPLLSLSRASITADARGEPVYSGILAGRTLLIATTGLGKVNAAVTTAAILEKFQPAQVWSTGCAGAYEGSGLRAGDILIAEESICGDEGVLTQRGVESLASIGIPLVSKGGEALYERFPLGQSDPVQAAKKLLPAGEYAISESLLPVPAGRGRSAGDAAAGRPGFSTFRIFYGPSLTVSMASGDAATAAGRARRYGALAENMEGSGIVQTCLRYGTPVLECRGVSNVAGNRNKSEWQIGLAASNCRSVLLGLIEGTRGGPA
jgi:futalosine hydrolase